ncbi:MAG TPA: nucleotidyltransferase family protein [Anaerolineales bacterium]|nr:nucleotidyltransferase family protein [Anaerolineales bacterium]
MALSPATSAENTQLLLNALRPDQTSKSWEDDRMRLNADWDDLAVRAIVLGLAPQFHHRLAQWGLAPAPRAAAKLTATYQAGVKRAADVYTQLGEVLTAFSANGLCPIALKGIHLAAAVYPDPALRPMNDIDLLFEAGELPKAESLLAQLGYSGKHKPADRGAGVTKHTSTFRRDAVASPAQRGAASTPNPYLSPDSDRMIEPHTSLEESWFGLKVDVTPGVRERAIEIELGRQPARVLAREDLLLHLCVHFCFHLIMGAPSMVQLTDLLAVIHTPALPHPHTPIDWPLFTTRALDHRAAPYALAALTLAGKLLGASAPAQSLDSLRQATPPPLRRRIESLGLADVLRRTQQKPITKFSQRIARGFSDRAETARWTQDWRGQWRVWRTALNIFATDTGQLFLRRNLKSPIPNL